MKMPPALSARNSAVWDPALVFVALGAAGSVAIFRDVVVGRSLGLGPALDAWTIGLAALGFATSAFVSAAGASLVPRLRSMPREPTRRRSEIVVGATVSAAAIGLVIGVISIVLVELLYRSAYPESELVSELVLLARWLGAVAVPSILICGVLTAVMHANGRFWPPALGPAVPATIVLVSVMYWNVDEITRLGALHATGLCTLAAILWSLVRAQEELDRGSWRQWRSVLADIRLDTTYAYLAALLVSFNPLIDYVVATSLGEGNAGKLGLASRVPIAAAALLASAVAIPLFPRLVDELKLQGAAAMAHLFRRRLGRATIATTVIGVAIAAVSIPLASVFFGGDSPLADEANSIGRIQMVYALTIGPYVAATLSVRALNARSCYRAALSIAALGCVLNIVLDVILASWFELTGIAAATVLVHSATATAMAWKVSR